MEIDIIEIPNDAPVKKKRGRKPKPKPEVIEPVVPKKRGRKPKGGKIINNPLEKSKESEYITENVILHLKCNSDDISKDIYNQLEGIENNNLSFHLLDEINENASIGQSLEFKYSINGTFSEKESDEELKNDTEVSNKIISDKIIELQKNFYFNDLTNNNSACFWCTYKFDHTSVHIPKYKLNDKYHVYGCFCSPECAVAHLFQESIDSSQKYERYQLLNFLYNNLNDKITNIKPAPNPHYLLDKFMGNMTITEYRELIRQDRVFIVVDKPITRILPEIYEETDGTNYDMLHPKTNFQVKKNNSKNSKKELNFFI